MKLVVLAVLGLTALATIAAGPTKDGRNRGSNCPEFCTCDSGSNGGIKAECERLTSTQLFDDQLVSFSMKENTDETNPLKFGRRYFVDHQMKSIDSITIINVDIDSLDVNAFEDLEYLRVLNLTNTNLISLNPETFVNNGDLELLSLSNNPLRIGRDPDSYILNAPLLIELDLSQCQLNELPTKAFSKVTGLTYLNLASNNLTVIDKELFNNLLSLEEINLSDNNLEILDTQLFDKNHELSKLVLKNNRLTTVGNIAIPSLIKLDLSFCRFTKLSSKSFKGFPELSLLNLSGNGLSSLDNASFATLTKLNYIDISNNNLRGPLNEELFIHNEELETISFQDNPLMKKLPVGGFRGNFDTLYMLDASNCGLDELSPNVFKTMSYLARLHLNGNSLSSLESVPQGLKVLQMSNNKVASLNDISFPKGNQITQLLLDGNEIDSLTPENFDNLKSLSKLDLSSCGIEKLWASDVEKSFNLDSIRELKLSNNDLRQISRGDLQVFSQLDSLDLLANPLSCDNIFKDTMQYLMDANVDPIRPENSPDNDEKYTWRSVMSSYTCTLPRSPKIQVEVISSSKSSSVTDEDDGDDDEDSDIDADDDLDLDEDDEIDDTFVVDKKFDRHGGIPTLLNISLASYQVIVLITVAVATFLVVIFLAVILKVCKQRLSQRGNLRRKRGSMSYRPLFNNEHLNTPTTPIFRPKMNSELPAEEEMENVVYRQTVGPCYSVSSSTKK